MRYSFAIAILFSAFAYAADIEGSADHPLMTRYPDSEITYYEVQEFMPYEIAVGPVTGYRHIDDWVPVEGKLTRINYDLMGDRSFYEVYKNYTDALKKAGFEPLAEGHVMAGERSNGVGSKTFIGVAYSKNELAPGATKLFTGSATSGGSAYFAGQLSRPEGDVYVVTSVYQYSDTQVVTFVDIIEARPMEDDLVTVDADYMAEEIKKVGKVVLYGILFDHDKATLKPESTPTLAEIAALLEANPEMKVWVVGHTDSTGSLDYNLKLSADRAASVVAALVSDYGVASERLDPHGVGPLVPVASNAEDGGQGKNRRVELVEQ